MGRGPGTVRRMPGKRLPTEAEISDLATRRFVVGDSPQRIVDTLLDAGAGPIGAVKALRAATGCGLAEAKRVLDDCGRPSAITATFFDEWRIMDALRDLLSLLARRKYRRVIASCATSRLTARDLKRVVRAYGATPVVPSEEAWEHMHAVRVTAAQDPTYAVDMPLWTAEEGRSDLELLCTCSFRVSAGTAQESLRIELDDLHVL